MQALCIYLDVRVLNLSINCDLGLTDAGGEIANLLYDVDPNGSVWI